MSWVLVGRCLAFGLAFLVCAELGRFLSFPENPHFATFWPAAGLYLATLALSPKRHWPLYVAVAVLINALLEWLLHKTSLPMTCAFCVANTLEAVLGGVLLQWVHRRPFHAETLADTLWLAGLGGTIAPLAGAAVGAAAVTSAFGDKTFWYTATVWWSADGVGALAVAPLLLTFPSQLAWKRSCNWKVWLEAAAVGLLVVAASLVAFGPKLSVQRSLPAYPFVVAPFLIWCGLRFGQFGTAVGVFLAGLIGVWGTTRGHGLFAHMETTLEMKATSLQIYLIVVTITPLMFATVIQQQRLAEDRLKQNLELLQAVMDGTGDAIFVKDLAGRYLLINEPGARLLGRTVEEVIGRGDDAFFDAATAGRIREEDLRTIESQQTQAYEAPATTINSPDVRYFHTTKGPYRDAQGRLVGVVGIARDITERKAVQQSLELAKADLEARVASRTAELVESNHRLRREMAERLRAEERLREQQTQLAHSSRLSSLGQMAAEMAHEVNQPLSAISNYVRGTQRRSRSGGVSLDDVLGTLEIIDREANRAADVIRRAKKFVRKQPVSREPLELEAVVREALALVDHDLREHQVACEVHLDRSLPKCLGDAVQLQQVVVNLVLNAADAMQCVPAGQRRISITAKANQETLELAIADSGPGISPQVTERIFDAFYSTKPEGVGLGLPISRGIIEEHGGKLWMEAGHDGGACLRLTIPIREETDDNHNGD